MVCGSFVVLHQVCSGLWSGSFGVFFPSSHPLFFSLPLFIGVTGAWNGGSWLGCRDLPAMGAVFYLGAGWPQWKPLGIPGTHLPLKRGSWLTHTFHLHALIIKQTPSSLITLDCGKDTCINGTCKYIMWLNNDGCH